MMERAKQLRELHQEFRQDFDSAASQQMRTPSSSLNVANLFDLVGRLKDIQETESRLLLDALSHLKKD